MIINKLKVLEEHWELVANNTSPRKGRRGALGRRDRWQDEGRERIGRMGNHYANEPGLNHTLPIIICWEELRLRGSLVCSTTGNHFCCVLSLTHSLLFPQSF